MLRIICEQWNKNCVELINAIRELRKVYSIEYADLVKLTFSTIYNKDIDRFGLTKIDTDNITKIDNGDYQGTLLFVLPFDSYHPGASEYLITYSEYGSCSVCDSLLAIIDYDNDQPTEEQIKGLFHLCKDIFCNTVKPFNNGWRNEPWFDEIKVAEEQKR